MNPAKHVGVFAVLGIWTLGPPLAIQQSPSGGLTVSVGAQGGEHVHRTFNCNGDVTSSEKATARGANAMLEFERGSLRVAGFGGGAETGGVVPTPAGFVGGALVAFEGESAGIGVGVIGRPHDGFGGGERRVDPSLYLRIGGRRAVHGRVEALTPSPLFGATGDVRFGPSFPIGGGALFTGLSGRSTGESRTAGWFADLELAATDRFRLLLAASVFPGAPHQDQGWGVGAGLQYRFW